MEPWWNLGGTLVDPSWNLTSGPPRTTLEPIWAETQSFQLLGKKKIAETEKGETILAGPPEDTPTKKVIIMVVWELTPVAPVMIMVIAYLLLCGCS